MKHAERTRMRMAGIVLSLAAAIGILLEFAPPSPGKANAFAAEELSLHSESAILVDAGTGGVLYEKNSTQKMYPASITKIVTALVAIENGNLDDPVKVSAHARNVEGTRVYLLEGEVVTMRKLLQGLLINSGNDAAIAIAEHIDGSERAFAERMNRFMEKIGAVSSHFENPHGLFDENHVTTALDMAKVMRYARSNPVFMEISGTKELDWKGEGWETRLYNHHELIRQDERVKAGKNGYIDQSGHTLVTYASDEGKEFIVVVLKAPSARHAYDDTGKLLDAAFTHTDTATIGAPRLYDAHGKQYLLYEPVAFQYLKNTSWKETVGEDGTLIIEGEYGTLAEHPLVEQPGMPDMKEAVRTAAVTASPEISAKRHAGLPLFAWMFLAAAALWAMRRYLRRLRRLRK